MKMTPLVLHALEELCEEDFLEVSVKLMEESVDMALSDDFFPDDYQGRDMARAFRRLGKALQGLLEALREEEQETEE